MGKAGRARRPGGLSAPAKAAAAAVAPAVGCFSVALKDLDALCLSRGLRCRRDFEEACRELELLLRCCFVASEKDVQGRLHDLVCLALEEFAICPGLKLYERACRQLVQASEFVLPAKKAAAVRRLYKQAGISSSTKRKQEEQQRAEFEESLPELPPEVVVLVLRYVDTTSLARAAAVCTVWRDTVVESRLWDAHVSHACGWKQKSKAANADRFDEHGMCALLPQADRRRLMAASSNRIVCMVCHTMSWLPHHAHPSLLHPTLVQQPQQKLRQKLQQSLYHGKEEDGHGRVERDDDHCRPPLGKFQEPEVASTLAALPAQTASQLVACGHHMSQQRPIDGLKILTRLRDGGAEDDEDGDDSESDSDDDDSIFRATLNRVSTLWAVPRINR